MSVGHSRILREIIMLILIVICRGQPTYTNTTSMVSIGCTLQIQERILRAEGVQEQLRACAPLVDAPTRGALYASVDWLRGWAESEEEERAWRTAALQIMRLTAVWHCLQFCNMENSMIIRLGASPTPRGTLRGAVSGTLSVVDLPRAANRLLYCVFVAYSAMIEERMSHIISEISEIIGNDPFLHELHRRFMTIILIRASFRQWEIRFTLQPSYIIFEPMPAGSSSSFLPLPQKSLLNYISEVRRLIRAQQTITSWCVRGIMTNWALNLAELRERMSTTIIIDRIHERLDALNVNDVSRPNAQDRLMSLFYIRNLWNACQFLEVRYAEHVCQPRRADYRARLSADDLAEDNRASSNHQALMQQTMRLRVFMVNLVAEGDAQFVEENALTAVYSTNAAGIRFIDIRIDGIPVQEHVDYRIFEHEEDEAGPSN